MYTVKSTEDRFTDHLEAKCVYLLGFHSCIMSGTIIMSLQLRSSLVLIMSTQSNYFGYESVLSS